MTEPLSPSDPTGVPASSPQIPNPYEVLELQDFIEPTSGESGTNDFSAKPPEIAEPPRLWWLGIGEALAWFFGALVVHIIVGMSLLLLIVVYGAMMTGKLSTEMPDADSMLFVTAGEMVGFVLAAMLAVSLRDWGRTFQELNLSQPEETHIAIVAGGTLPLSFCVSAWSIPIQFAWVQIKQVLPSLEFLDRMNAMEAVKEMAESTSLPLMILVVAVLPAIGEELVFRGAMGRVLVQHLGIWTGILVTSILFGLVHIHPVHAFSVIPLGIAMHVIYLWTRSFWMPVLLHFLNNSWASVLTKLGAAEPLEQGTEMSTLEWIQMVTAVIAAVLLTISLWQSRVRWFRADGTEWVSSRFPIRDPASGSFERKTAGINSICWYTALFCVVACHIAVIMDLMQPKLGNN